MVFQFFTTPIAEASVTSVINSINKVLINPLIILLFALATVYFLYGLVEYFTNPDNKDAKEITNRKITYGLIGMFIMIAVYGILNTYLNTIGEKRIEINRSRGEYRIETIIN